MAQLLCHYYKVLISLPVHLAWNLFDIMHSPSCILCNLWSRFHLPCTGRPIAASYDCQPHNTANGKIVVVRVVALLDPLLSVLLSSAKSCWNLFFFGFSYSHERKECRWKLNKGLLSSLLSKYENFQYMTYNDMTLISMYQFQHTYHIILWISL